MSDARDAVCLEALCSMHKHLLGDSTTKRAVLDTFFAAATGLVQDLSLITVREVGGFETKRSHLLGGWPSESLANVLNQPSLLAVTDEQIFHAQNWQGIHIVDDVMSELASSPVYEGLITAIREAEEPISLRSLISVPLALEGTEPGDPSRCNFYSPRQLSSKEKTMLEMLTKQTAAALLNANHQVAQRRLRAAIDLLTETIARITDPSGCSIESLIDFLTRQLSAAFDVDAAYCILIQESSDLLSVRGWDRRTGSLIGNQSSYQGVAGMAVRDQRTVVKSSEDADWFAVYVARVAGINTCAAIPLHTGAKKKLIGAFVLESTSFDAFTRDDISLMEAIVSHVPVALSSARAVDALREVNEQLRQVNEQMRSRESLYFLGASKVFFTHSLRGYIRKMHELATVEMAKILANVPIDVAAARSANERIVTQAVDVSDFLGQFRDTLETLTSPSFTSFTRTPLKPLLESAVASVRSQRSRDLSRSEPTQSEESSILFRVDTDEAIILYTANQIVKEIVTSLVDNAATATRKAVQADPTRDARVTVRALIDKGFAIIDVLDSGFGVPSEQVSTLFKIFQPRTATGGWGVGLTISRVLAEVGLNGTLELSDNGEHGACFRLRLPLREPSIKRTGDAHA